MSEKAHKKRSAGIVAVAFGLLAALATAGCGKGRGQVSGTVSYLGRPLPDGTVLLLASDGQAYDAPIGPDGRFTITGVPPGEAKVAVTSFAPAGEQRQELAGDLAPVTNARLSATTHTASRIPLRHGDLEQSGHRVRVAGDTRFDLDLR
jgi:hypothetical protein